jgi:hypothetical protein
MTPLFNFFFDEQEIIALGVQGANYSNYFGHFKIPSIKALIRPAKQIGWVLFKIDSNSTSCQQYYGALWLS